MTDQQPTKGRIVHYVAHGTPVRPDGSQAFRSECVVAIVTGVADPDGSDDDLQRVHLFVISDKGVHFQRDIPLSDHRAHQNGGTWHWHTQCANA